MVWGGRARQPPGSFPGEARLDVLDEGPDALAHDSAPNVAGRVHAEDEQGQVVVAAQRDGRRVHHLEIAREDLGHVDGLEAPGAAVAARISGVDAVNLGGLHHDIGADFEGAQAGCRVGREIGVAGAAAEDDHATAFEVSQRALPVEGLGHVLHGDRGLHAGVDALARQSVLQGEGVDAGREHADGVTTRPIDALCRARDTAEDVAAADDEAHLDTDSDDLRDLSADAVDGGSIDGRAGLTHQGFAGEFEENAGVTRSVG